MLKGLFRVLLVSALFPTIALAQRKHVFILQFGSPVAGEPFSATRTLDYEPAVNSTDPVAYHAEEKVFRDSAGRMRSEIKYPNQLPTVHIYDFVGHMYYMWTVGDTVVTSARINEAVWGAHLSVPEKLDADAPLIEGIPTPSHPPGHRQGDDRGIDRLLVCAQPACGHGDRHRPAGGRQDDSAICGHQRG